MILALDDGEQPVGPAEAEVGPFVAGAAHLLDLVAQGLEELGDELLERLGGQRGQLGELQVGAARLAILAFDALAALADRLAQLVDLGLVPRRVRRVEAEQVAIDLEQRVVDRVVQPRPLGPGQLVLVAPEDGVLQVLEGAGQLAGRCDRRSLLLVRGGRPEQALLRDGSRPETRRSAEPAARALSHSSSISAHCGPRHSISVLLLSMNRRSVGRSSIADTHAAGKRLLPDEAADSSTS